VRLLLVMPILLLAAVPVMADIRLLGDWTYSYTESEIEERDSAEATNSESNRFRQLYRADLSRPIYPTLLLNAGALFERSDLDNEINGDETETTGELLRPYIDVELDNTLYTLAGGYRESEITSSGTGLRTTHQFVEEYDARAEWQPVDLPGIEAAYTRTLRSTEPETTDQESHIYRLTTDYTYRHYDFLYNYLRADEEQQGIGDESGETRALTQTHNGRVRYSRVFLDNRFNVNARVQAERSTVEFSGTGERILRTTPLGTGFFLLDDLAPDTNLPGEFTFVPPGSFADVNLGGGGGNDPVSVGLSFGEETTLDLIRVLLDPALDDSRRLEIDSFEAEWRWQVFVSDDQLDWDPVPVTAVDYDPIANYFEIRFVRAVDVEFVKVVTTPVALNPLNLGPLFDIPVFTVQSFVTLTPEQGDEIVSVTRNLNFGAGWKVTERTRVGYDLAYQDQEVDVFDIENRQLSNIFTLTHIFNPVFSSSARLLRNDRWQQGEHDTTSHQFTAQVTGRYLPTLRQSLTYSGEQTEEPEGDSSSNAVFLRTNAELYRGWDASFDQGYTWQDQAEQGETSSFFLRLASSIAPHRRLNFILDYAVRWTQQSDRDDRRDQNGRLRGFWAPTDTINLVGEFGVRETEESTFTEWEYGVGWLPFRDGTLQVNIRYNEEGDSDDELLRSFSPSLTWEVARNAHLTLTYTLGTQEDRTEKVDFQSAQANFRIFYN
jgi:hypothetical protein